MDAAHHHHGLHPPPSSSVPPSQSVGPRIFFKIPRVVPKQRERFESEDIFKRSCRDQEVSDAIMQKHLFKGAAGLGRGSGSCFFFLPFTLWPPGMEYSYFDTKCELVLQSIARFSLDG